MEEKGGFRFAELIHKIMATGWFCDNFEQDLGTKGFLLEKEHLLVSIDVALLATSTMGQDMAKTLNDGKARG